MAEVSGNVKNGTNSFVYILTGLFIVQDNNSNLIDLEI